MLNNFIGGGQIFLHKLRMFGQVFFRNLHLSLTIGLLSATILNWSNLKTLDWNAFISYRKAILAEDFNDTFNRFRITIGKEANYKFYIDDESANRIYRNIESKQILRMSSFRKADKVACTLLLKVLILAIEISAGVFVMIYLWWSRFGSGLKSEVKKKGSDEILTAKEVRKKLNSLQLASAIKIGNMPIVKDSETRHFLISGSTGSGKTNLFHNILPQIEQNESPAVVIDQTGEMVAKYYNPDRSDIIFNPFDERSAVWDFWKDCELEEDLERFTKILFGFNRKSTGSNNEPFWEQSAEVIFNACALSLRKQGNYSIEELTKLVTDTSRAILKTKLIGTKASRYLEEDGKTTASSILSVLATLSKPLTYLKDIPNSRDIVENTPASYKHKNKIFSLKEYFAGVRDGKEAWLFLSTKPSARDLTLPLSACLTELALAQLMDIGIDQNRRIWFVIDELASLKKLPALGSLITEGRKYGACILAGLQSLNQLYEYYGHHGGSTIFGQFGTNFFFRNNEPTIAKMITSMCGIETITRHQKNTSFGANEFRDGVSYNEQERKKNLVEYSDLANLQVKECFVLMPEPKVRVARIDVPSAKIPNKNEGFIPKKTELKSSVTDSKNNNSSNTDDSSQLGASPSSIGGILDMDNNPGFAEGNKTDLISSETKNSSGNKSKNEQNIENPIL